ncbi:hypothetical protein [Arsukibacterium sp.]|uniref:hypothetical protein n=1 Tax=Arsukibacterium sp. TaxID=1977258 RepID=UPI0035643421
MLFVVLVVLISGCGGSDSSSDPNIGGGSGGGNSSDPLQQYINVSSQYTGVKSAANLDKSAVSRFMSAITMLQPELLPEYDDEQANTTELCADGGVAVLRPNAANTELAVLFTGCNDGGVVLNGDATFRVVRRNVAGDVIEGLMIYQDTVLSYDSAQFVLRGSIRQKDISNSCYAEQYLSNLLLSIQGTNEQWYFENFYDQRFGAYGQGCQSEGMQFRGRLYLSDVGFVDVTTPQLLKLPSMVYGLERQGHLAFTGVAGQTFSWQFKKSGTNSQPLYSHHFSLTGDNAFTYQYRANYLNTQMMTDFRDTDGDDMSDAWELNFGFDPQNASDALTDQDGDGFSNLEEFTYLGDPKDITVLPFIYELSVSLNHTPGRQSQLVYVSTPISHTFGSDAYTVELLYKTELPFQFSDQNYNCTVTGDRLEARCRIEYIQVSTQYEHSVSLEAPSSFINEIHAPISVSIHTLGLNTSLQTTASAVISRQAAEFNFTLTQPNPDIGSLLGIVGEQSSMTLKLSQSGLYDFVSSISVNVVMPDELGNSQVVCRQDVDWKQCANLVVAHGGATTDINITFTPASSGTGMGEIQIMVAESSEPAAIWSFPVISGQPASLLQQQIDSADEGIIIVPAEIYVGGLDLTAKKVTLQGENQQTYLLGKTNNDDYSLRQIRMDKGSEITGFSLANLSITIGSSGAALTSNRMAIPELLLEGNDILAQGSLTLKKNKFSTAALSHSFSWGNPISLCNRLRLQQNDSATPYNFVYENNLMVNDGMQANYCSPIYLEGGYLSRVEHNTISEIDEFINISPANETKVSRLLTRNNVFSAVTTAVALNFAMQNFDSQPDLKIEVLNNLFDQVVYPVRTGNVPYTLAASIMGAAGLNHAGIPLAGSAVIDTAASSAVTDDIFSQARPVDGNGDGQALSDIGAVERQN